MKVLSFIFILCTFRSKCQSFPELTFRDGSDTNVLELNQSHDSTAGMSSASLQEEYSMDDNTGPRKSSFLHSSLRKRGVTISLDEINSLKRKWRNISDRKKKLKLRRGNNTIGLVKRNQSEHKWRNCGNFKGKNKVNIENSTSDVDRIISSRATFQSYDSSPYDVTRPFPFNADGLPKSLCKKSKRERKANGTNSGMKVDGVIQLKVGEDVVITNNKAKQSGVDVQVIQLDNQTSATNKLNSNLITHSQDMTMLQDYDTTPDSQVWASTVNNHIVYHSVLHNFTEPSSLTDAGRLEKADKSYFIGSSTQVYPSIYTITDINYVNLDKESDSSISNDNTHLIDFKANNSTIISDSANDSELNDLPSYGSTRSSRTIGEDHFENVPKQIVIEMGTLAYSSCTNAITKKRHVNSGKSHHSHRINLTTPSNVFETNSSAIIRNRTNIKKYYEPLAYEVTKSIKLIVKGRNGHAVIKNLTGIESRVHRSTADTITDVVEESNGSNSLILPRADFQAILTAIKSDRLSDPFAYVISKPSGKMGEDNCTNVTKQKLSDMVPRAFPSTWKHIIVDSKIGYETNEGAGNHLADNSTERRVCVIHEDWDGNHVKDNTLHVGFQPYVYNAGTKNGQATSPAVRMSSLPMRVEKQTAQPSYTVAETTSDHEFSDNKLNEISIYGPKSVVKDIALAIASSEISRSYDNDKSPVPTIQINTDR